MKKWGLEKNHCWNFEQNGFLMFSFISNRILCIILLKWYKSEDLTNHSWNFVKIEFLCFLLFKIGFSCFLLF